jgi:hypothetical protein
MHQGLPDCVGRHVSRLDIGCEPDGDEVYSIGFIEYSENEDPFIKKIIGLRHEPSDRK